MEDQGLRFVAIGEVLVAHAGFHHLNVAEPLLTVKLRIAVRTFEHVSFFCRKLTKSDHNLQLLRARESNPVPALADANLVVGGIGRHALQLYRATVQDINHIGLLVGDALLIQVAKPFLAVKLRIAFASLDRERILAQTYDS